MIRIVIVLLLLTLTAVATSVLYHVTQQGDIAYYQGHRLFREGDYAEAIPYFRQALAVDPRHIRALTDLGYACQWTERPDEAIAAFRKVLAARPDDQAIRTALAETLSWRKEYPEAIRLFEEAIAVTGDRDVRLKLAEILQWNGQFDRSKEILEGLDAGSAHDVKTRLHYARALLYTGEPERADEILISLRGDPAVADAGAGANELEKLLAESAMMRRDYAAAVERYRRRLALSPDDAAARADLADILSWSKRYDESIAEYEALLEHDPQDVDTMVKLARVYSWVKRYDEAVTLLRQVLRERPDDDASRELFADIRSWQGVYGEAIAAYEELLRNRPDDVTVMKKLADTASWAKEYATAVAFYRRLLEQAPGDTASRVALARILSWDRRFDEAAAAYRDVLERDPGNREALLALGELSIWQRRYEEAISYFEELLAAGDDPAARLLYGQALLYAGEYEAGRAVFEDLLQVDPGNAAARVFLADSFAYEKEFARAIALYREALAAEPDRETKRKLADVLSWDRRYTEAIALYDELLDGEIDEKVWRQKARVLGWARKYPEALAEYRELVAWSDDPLIRIEMEAKEAYWDDRVDTAIDRYRKLIAEDPENVEAMFDLAQIYSYESRWQEAIDEYERILSLARGHFRAREGLEKVLTITRHVAWRAGYERFEADSLSRDMDIRKHTIINHVTGYVRPDITLEGWHRFTTRSFADFSNVIENEEKLRVSYLSNPAGWARAYYDLIVYNKDIDPMHTFGAEFGWRVIESAVLTVFYDRQRLENSSSVIRWHAYEDDCKARVDVSLSKRLKLGADYTYAHYWDRNFRNEPAFDVLYFFSLDPLRLSMRYRFFYKEFDDKTFDYWSPKGFSTNAVSFNWRHFLNTEEIFFGGDDIYYDAGYTFSVDSTNVVGHLFTGGIHWDVNKRLTLDVQGGFSTSSNTVYRESGMKASVRYYF